MELEIELRNYRCFAVGGQARFVIGSGFMSFIGVNNSGKSSLLRFFWEFRPIFQQLAQLTQLPKAKDQRLGVSFQGIQDPEEVFTNTNESGMWVSFSLREWEEAGSGLPPPSRLTLELDRPVEGAQTTLRTNWEIAGKPVKEPVWANEILQDGEAGQQADVVPFTNCFRDLANSLYLGPFRNAINQGAANYYDLQIGQAFITQWDQFKSGSQSKRQNRAAIRLTDELRHIFGLKTLELNAAPDGQTLQVIADGQSYRLDEQGAGLAQFVIVMAFVATRRSSFVFIDEPEMNLHPALQLDFLTASVPTRLSGSGLQLTALAWREPGAAVCIRSDVLEAGRAKSTISRAPHGSQSFSAN